MGAKMLTRSIIEQIEFCFRATYLQDGTEDRVLIYTDEQGHLLAARPDMMRSRGAVECDVPLSYEHKGRMWDLAYDLHSHHEMGAFWSPTDNANECIRGPVFGVFSWRDGPQWKFRRWVGPAPGFVDLPYEAVVADG